MARVRSDELLRLSAALGSTDYLRKIVDEIERLHVVVFHDYSSADWTRVRRSAEQVLIAEIATRYQGRVEGVHEALCQLERQGRSWDAAIAALAGAMHSYHTTPLGIVMRKDLFGDDAVFFTADALQWIEKLSRGETGRAGRS